MCQLTVETTGFGTKCADPRRNLIKVGVHEWCREHLRLRASGAEIQGVGIGHRADWLVAPPTRMQLLWHFMQPKE
jgi:hypothetical protein